MFLWSLVLGLLSDKVRELIMCPKSYICPTCARSMTPELMERFAVKQYHYFGHLKKNTIFMHSSGKKLLWVWLECPEKEWKKGHVRKVSVMALYSPKVTKKDCSLLPDYKAVNSCVVTVCFCGTDPEQKEYTEHRGDTIVLFYWAWFSQGRV